MAITDVFKRALAGELHLVRGRVLGLEPSGAVRVRIGSDSVQDVTCEALQTGAAAPRFACGEDVLVAFAEGSKIPGVILGAIGRSLPSGTENARPEAPEPTGAPAVEREGVHRLQHREIVIEAGEDLILKCGEASIRITQDGKIVIRGEHVLSRARGTQRIKGGSVAIN